MIVNAAVNQVNAELIRVGAKAAVRLDAFPDILLPAEVYSVGAMIRQGATGTGGYVKDVPVALRLLSTDPPGHSGPDGERGRIFYHLLLASLGLAALVPWWPLRTAMSLLAGLLLVRAFIVFHDLLHNAIMRGSIAARALVVPVRIGGPHSASRVASYPQFSSRPCWQAGSSPR